IPNIGSQAPCNSYRPSGNDMTGSNSEGHFCDGTPSSFCSFNHQDKYECRNQKGKIARIGWQMRFKWPILVKN
ncbi:MAG: hypothetical protein PVJ41_14935, partial [Desulfobacterales bacterium]